jgi:endonuclease YncB( thermonuclease family)
LKGLQLFRLNQQYLLLSIKDSSLLLDGTHVNHTLVKDGWWWWYRKYTPGDIELEQLEQDARKAKKGLWADPAPIPPWVYRKAR